MPRFISKTNLIRMNDTSRVAAEKAIKKIGALRRKLIQQAPKVMLPEKFYGMMNVECPCFDKGNLIKHKKGDTGALRTTTS